MDFFLKIVLFFHLMGFASLFGVAAYQVRAQVKIAKNGMMHGALTQLITGPILAMLEHTQIDQTAAVIKLLIVLVIVGILAYYRRDPARIIPARAFFTVFALTFAEVLIAVFWLQTS